MKRLTVLLVLLIFTISLSYGGTVRGVIIDKDTGESLLGANVILVGTVMGATTDEDGVFLILNVPEGSYQLSVEYIGYEKYSTSISVGEETVDLNISLKPTTILGDAITVVADRATFRETPVAFTNVDKPQITNQLGSRDIPLILNSTPGVYATDQGGGAGDARINIRGFNQSNVAVMVNGVPVNDMENGWVYWSNWDGLGDVTSSIQVQRGLGASNLAIASVGGTMNILTDAAAAKRGVSFKQEYGAADFLKSTLVLNTGLMENGFAATVAAVRKTGHGIADQTWTDAWAYFGALSYTINENHRVDLYAIGAPQKHGQRYNTNTIATYDADYARKLYEDENLPQSDFDALDTLGNAGDYGVNYNGQWGPIFNYNPKKLEEYYNGSVHNFPMRVPYLDGKKVTTNAARVIMQRENYYHKPQFNLNYYWKISPKVLWTNVAYLSIGRGGGSGPAGEYTSNISEGEFAGQIDWQAAYDFNVANIDSAYSTTETRSDYILRNSVNLHFWYGILSTAEYTMNENIKLTFGIDGRYYKGEHWQEVRNLLGGDYYIDTGDKNQTTSVKRLGDKISYHNDGITRWLGGFAQIEGKFDRLTTFGTFSLSNTGYKRIDYFIIPTPERPKEIGYENFMGGTVKIGANYNINKQFNVFSNVGYISKAPIFDAVFDFSHTLYKPTFNEKIYNFELGTGYTTPLITVNGNFYYTRWNDRSWSKSALIGNDNFYFLLHGIDALHTGVEFDAKYRPHRMLELYGMASVGNWKWLNDVSTTFAPENNPDSLQSFNVYVKDLKVGDAAQTTFTAAATVYPFEGLWITASLKRFANNYADFDPAERDDPNDRAQPWKIPNYNIVDLHAGYYLPFKNLGVRFQLVGHVFNLLDTQFVTDAEDRGNHTAADVRVWLGLERRFNLGLNIEL
jgi:iron complex outermembrane receptor protein